MVAEPAAVLTGAEPQGTCVQFTWSDGFAVRFSCAWLLDNAASAQAGDRGQRLRSALSLGTAGALRGVTIAGDVARCVIVSAMLKAVVLTVRPAPAVRLPMAS